MTTLEKQAAAKARKIHDVQSVLDSIKLDPKYRASINYAKARTAIEEHLPSALPYKEHIATDKLFILANLKKEHSYYANMKAYLLKSESLSESERKQL